MYISKFQIENYKSFLSSQVIKLTSGFNMVVGQNDVGKTALVEALGLQIINKPHRSLTTVPRPTTLISNVTKVRLAFQLEKKETEDLLIDQEQTFHIPMRNLAIPRQEAQNFIELINRPITLECVFTQSGLESAFIAEYGTSTNSNWAAIHIEERRLKASDETVISNQSPLSYSTVLANLLRQRIYFFQAERLNVSRSPFGTAEILNPNASNLAEVLHNLQSKNNRFAKFNAHVTEIFPHIKWISVPSGPNANEVQIRVSSIDPKLEREDLAVPLSESGTGIGQVLAILYVVITANYPKVIVIDEPQSFLHPGAARKLIEILKQSPQHQFIITSHSPEIMVVANPKTFLLLRKDEFETKVERMDISIAQNLRIFLSEIGVRLSDVFGADNILWVEGSTEEQCFPLIFEKISNKHLLGTKIMGVVQTGDFEGKHSKTIFEIYDKLSKSNGLIPPAIGFIFDKEKRTLIDQDDLKRRSNNKVVFLGRRMYENYLLNPRAIANVISSLENFRVDPVTSEEIEQWISNNRHETKYCDIREISGLNESGWVNNIHGAKLLEDIFKKLSGSRYNYDKIEHGIALSMWLL